MESIKHKFNQIAFHLINLIWLTVFPNSVCVCVTKSTVISTGRVKNFMYVININKININFYVSD